MAAFTAAPALLGTRTTKLAARAPRRLEAVRCEANPESSRRTALALVAGVGAALSVKPAEAAYGEGANILGKITNKSGFLPYAGEGFSVLIPSKWNPGGERDFPGSVLRWEDNGDQVTHLLVTKNKTDKSSIDQYGTPDKFLDNLKDYIGQQVFAGETQSEGGFESGKVSKASLLDTQVTKDNNGKTYYKYEILVRTADGNEGGRHVLLTAAVGGSQLYVAKIQVGDKRWFKGADKEALTTANSFTVA